jgi:hypothetical protein
MQSLKEHGKNFLFVSVMLSAVYLPVILSNFLHHDDYWLLEITGITKSGKQCKDLGQYFGLVQIGRPLAAELMCFFDPILTSTTEQDITKTYHFFRLLRIESLLCIIAAFFCLALAIKRYFKDYSLSLLIPSLIFFLPGVGVFISWAVMGIFSPGFIFLALSFLLAINLASIREFGQIRKSEYLFSSIFSILFLFISFNFYPSIGFLYLCLPMTIIALSTKNTWKAFRVSAYLQMTLLVSSCVIYFLFQKLIISNIFNEKIIGQEARSLTISSLNDIWDRLNTFFAFDRNFFWRAANLWFLDIKNNQSNYIIGIILSGLILAIIAVLIKLLRKKSANHRILFWIGSEKFFLTLIILSCVGSLAVVHQLVHQFRVLVDISAIITILLIWAIGYWLVAGLKIFKLSGHRKKILTGLSIMAIIITGAIAQYNTTQYYAQTSIQEMAYFESKALALLRGDQDGLILIRPKGNFFIAGHEYGMPTSRWKSRYGVAGMFQMVARKYGLNSKLFKIKAPHHENYAFFYKEGPLNKIDTIDMNNFVFRKLQKKTTLNLLLERGSSPSN